MIGTGPCGEWQKLALQNLGQLRVQKILANNFGKVNIHPKYQSELILKLNIFLHIEAKIPANLIKQFVETVHIYL